jgi:radical SAM protein with 4Fe4S-binding SPASM domain
MREINLLKSAPRIARKFDPNWRTDENRVIAKRFDKEFFDGDRVNGYGGYTYDGRWKNVVNHLKEIYGINSESSVLDIGCAKGFLLYDLQEMIPGIKTAGIDISDYAINHAMDGHENQTAKEKVLPFMIKGSADNLPYPDKSFDVVLSINTIHNLPIERCKRAIQEMMRVCKYPEKMFIQVDTYRNNDEKKLMQAWNLTALTMLHIDEWISLFNEVGYKGDYFWTTFNLENEKIEIIQDQTKDQTKARPEIDNHKLMYHPKKVAQWVDKGDCYPMHIEIGITARCNHKCIFCALDFLEHRGDMDTQTMLDALKEMGENGVKSVMFGGEGEPLLHKDIALIVKKAKEYGLDVAITTNGIFFDQEKIEQCLPYLSWIKFSVDAGTPESYAKIHGTNETQFFKLFDNLKKAVEYKKQNNLKSTIGTQFLMIPENLNESILLAKKLSEIGVDYLSIKPYSHHPNSLNNLIVNPEEYNKIEGDLKGFDTDNFKVFFRKETIKRIQEGNAYPECYGLSFFCLIDAKGNVLPCNLFYENPDFTYGNLNEKSFIEIWEGEQRKKVLEKIRKKGVDKCRVGCRCDVINRYLNRLRNPLAHDNFI